MDDKTPRKTLIIACGALAREVLAVTGRNGMAHLSITCLPAIYHNRPEKIAPAVRRKIRANRTKYDEILCLYGDCGTAGALDQVLKEEGVERIEGPHCFAFFPGLAEFDAMQDDEIGTFYLTDFLARHFERLVIKGFGLDRRPELLPMFFGNYTRLVYLVQVPDAAIERKARAAAERLGLKFEMRFTGLGAIEDFVAGAPGSRVAAA